MRRSPDFDSENRCFFVTTNTYHGMPLFCDARNVEIFFEAVQDSQKKFSFELPGYVIMPDHVHLLVLITGPNVSISQIMHSIKGICAYKLIKQRGHKGPAWQRRFYEHVIRDERDFLTKLNYIHNNPVQAGLVEEPGDYPYSSYREWYANPQG